MQIPPVRGIFPIWFFLSVGWSTKLSLIARGLSIINEIKLVRNAFIIVNSTILNLLIYKMELIKVKKYLILLFLTLINNAKYQHSSYFVSFYITL